MKVQYIKHSGFLVEFEKSVLIFDYYCGKFLEPEKEKHLYFFVSHRHPDHFNPKIFQYAKDYPNITFLLSDDIHLTKEDLKWKEIPQEAWDKMFYLGPNQIQQISREMKVETLTSTDEGVAFLVDYTEDEDGEPVHLYHAGDLNWWTWIGETKEEYEEMTARFEHEMQKLEGRSFDLAFVPLDPRQEERFWWGFDRFVRTTDTKLAVPMHCWDDYSVIGRLKGMEESRPYRDRIAEISGRGEWVIQ